MFSKRLIERWTVNLQYMHPHICRTNLKELAIFYDNYYQINIIDFINLECISIHLMKLRRFVILYL